MLVILVSVFVRYSNEKKSVKSLEILVRLVISDQNLARLGQTAPKIKPKLFQLNFELVFHEVF